MLRTFSSRHSRQLFTLALPLMAQALLGASMSFIDALMVGQLGEQVIAALGNAAQLLLFGHILLAALYGGGSVLLAQQQGASQPQRVAHTVSSLCLVGTICGLIMAAAFILAGEWLASLVTLELWRMPAAESAVAPLTGNYLAIVGWTIPLVVLESIIAIAFQTSGDTRTPVKVALVFNLLNVVGNWLLIFGAAIPGINEPLFTPMGYLGAAISTAVASAGAALSLLWIAARRHPDWFSQLASPCTTQLASMLRIGLPMSVDGFYWQGARLFYTLLMNTIGAKAFAVYIIVRTLKGLLMLPAEGLNQAAHILVGQILGAGKFQRAQLASRHSIRLTLLITCLPVAVILWGADLFLTLYQIQPETAANARICLYILAISLFATAINAVVPALLESGGDSLSTMHITLGCFLLVGAPASWLLGITLEFGLIGAFVGVSLEEIAKALVLLWRLKQGHWLKKLA